MHAFLFDPDVLLTTFCATLHNHRYLFTRTFCYITAVGLYEGAGLAGIVTAKEMLENGLDVVIFESDSAPFGLWGSPSERDQWVVWYVLFCKEYFCLLFY